MTMDVVAVNVGAVLLMGAIAWYFRLFRRD